MPAYTSVPIDYEAYYGRSDVFAKTKDGFPASFDKTTAASEPRQLHFNRQITRLAEVTSPGLIPVFVHWQSGERNRMDRGCIGHAIAWGILEVTRTDRDGTVTHVGMRLQGV